MCVDQRRHREQPTRRRACRRRDRRDAAALNGDVDWGTGGRPVGRQQDDAGQELAHDTGSSMRLTWAATMRQPSEKRIQVCVCRPILPEHCRAGTEWLPPRNPTRRRRCAFFRACARAHVASAPLERIDRLIAVEAFCSAVADDGFARQEEAVERRDVVGDQGLLVGSQTQPSTSALASGSLIVMTRASSSRSTP